MLAPYVEAREDGPMLEFAERSLSAYDELISRVASDGVSSVLYRRTGSLEVATDEVRMDLLRRTASRLEARRVDFQILDAAGARDHEPALAEDVVGGLLIPSHGFVAAAGLTIAVAAAAVRHGVTLVDGARVRRVGAHGQGLVVDTTRGALTADAVVLAAGSWSSQIEIEGAEQPLPVRPVRGQLVRLACNGTPLRRITWGPRCYLVPWDDGTLLVGATMEEAGFDERATAAGVRDLLDAVCELVPIAWTAGFAGARAGLRPATADRLPIIGWSRVLPGLMYATGHFRNGILLAPLTATIVADALMDGREDPALALFSPARFGAI
jgi:glycine oxidase